MKKWLLLCAALAVLLAGWRPAAKEPEGLAWCGCWGWTARGQWS